ncbi:MAG: hypothetical protein PWP14_2092 [Methanolobus sp.]|nr:hypothetical protein [Methanolobus sp.]
MLWFTGNSMEKVKTVVKGINMGKDNEILRDSAYQDSKFSMDIVCVDSSFIETKKGQDSAYNGHKKRNGIKVHVCASCEGFPLTI